jgi:predicted O-methyltransferase YrrM
MAPLNLVPSDINGYGSPEDPGEPGTGKPRLSVNDEEGLIIQTLFRGLTVIEIGTGLGVSTNHLTRVCKHVDTFDIDPWVAERVAPNLPSNCTFHVDYMQTVGLPQYDAALIDGLHTKEQCAEDIAFVCKHLPVGGFILFHDLYIHGVFEALSESGLPFVHVQTTAGLALAWLTTVIQ